MDNAIRTQWLADMCEDIDCLDTSTVPVGFSGLHSRRLIHTRGSAVLEDEVVVVYFDKGVPVLEFSVNTDQVGALAEHLLSTAKEKPDGEAA